MVQCRIKTFLSDWIKEKNKFTSVSMIRLVYDGVAHDYTKWKFSGQNIFFYDSNNRVETILWTTETITIVDDNCIVINAGHNKLNIGLELFYGGAIL